MSAELPPPSTPIGEALIWLRDNTRLTAGEYKQLLDQLPPAYRTLGDLQYIITRGECDKGLAKKLESVLK